MANYVVSDTNLTSVADAIRAKGGTSAPLSFPTEFVSAIQAIPTGGGGGGDSSKPVRFLDYDGTVVQSYTAEEFAALEAMPENPDHSGDEIPLTAQGWNWSLADAKAYVAKYGALEVGQMYITTDGKTHIKIYIDPDTPTNRRVMTLRWTQTEYNGVTVDWGDGTEPESYSGNTAANRDHTYAQTGWYDITLTVTNGTMSIVGNGSMASIIGNVSGANSYKCALIRAVYFGSGLSATGINASVFYNCYAVATVTIPNGITSIGNNVFKNCYSLISFTIPYGVTTLGADTFYECRNLRNITIPNSIVTIGNQMAYNCVALDRLIIPDSITSIGSSMAYSCYNLTNIIIPDTVTVIQSGAFSSCRNLANLTLPVNATSIAGSVVRDCFRLSAIIIPSGVTVVDDSFAYNDYSLASVTLPNGITNIKGYAFQNCSSLTSIIVPSSVTEIGSYAFGNCYSISEYHILPTTPPTIQSTTFNQIPSDCIIYVPAASVEDYKAAANWSALASKIQAEPA